MQQVYTTCEVGTVGKIVIMSIALCLVSEYFRFADGNSIASDTFLINSKAPIGNGYWRATASCTMSFPAVNFNVGESYILVKFGVPSYSNVVDNSNGAIIAQDLKWYITLLGYASNSMFAFTVQFDYDAWLGSVNPTGTCDIYIGLADAVQDAQSEPELIDTLGDPLLSRVPLILTALSGTIASGSCSFSFAGMSFGVDETVIFVNFTVPVTNFWDNSGSSIDVIGSDDTWYMSRNAVGSYNTFYYTNNFHFTSSNRDIHNAECYLYRPATSLTVDPSTSLDTIFSPTILTTIYLQTTTTPATGTFENSTSFAGITQSFGTSRDRDTLFEATDMRDRFDDSGSIWQRFSKSILRCSRFCLIDPLCASVFFEKSISICTAHSARVGSGIVTTNVQYFIVK